MGSNCIVEIGYILYFPFAKLIGLHKCVEDREIVLVVILRFSMQGGTDVLLGCYDLSVYLNY
jgi:hypothetical protein